MPTETHPPTESPRQNATGTVYGYARVSTGEQDTEAQRAALEAVGATVVEETASGGSYDRAELQALMARLRAGDTLIVTKLDRLTRSLADLLRLLADLDARGVAFRSLGDPVDTTTAAGRMIAHVIGAFAEFERGLIRERTRNGLANAKRHGRVGGRPKALSSEQAAEVIDAVRSGRQSQAEAARLFEVHPATVMRLVRRARLEATEPASAERASG